MVKENLPLSKQIAYSLGNTGKSMLSGIIGTYLIYFYIPTTQSKIGLFIPQYSFLGLFTVMGIITMVGKLFDAFTDPWVASLSDRCRSSMGRRIPFMRWSAFPYALFTVLVFCCPIGGENKINVVYLTVALFLCCLFSTMYSTPYNTLLCELAYTSGEKINLSTFSSIAWVIGYAAVSLAPSLWRQITYLGVGKTLAVRISFGLIAFGGLVCLMVPVMAIDERHYCEARPSSQKTLASVRAALSNREFRSFVFSNLFYMMANGIFQSSLLYYITVLLRRGEETLGKILIWGGIWSFLFYYPVTILAKRHGKRKLLEAAFCIYMFLYIYGFFLGKLPLSIKVQGIIMVLLVSPALAIFGILPNAVAADIAQYDVELSGKKREGAFFGTRTLITKLGNVLYTFMLSGLLLIKRNGSSELGIRLTFVASALFSLLGLVFIRLYDEKKVLQLLEKRE